MAPRRTQHKEDDKYEILRKRLEEKGICPDCLGLISIRNPTGRCDHLCYPEYKNKDDPKSRLYRR